MKEAEGDEHGAHNVLLRCWRFEAAREDRFYDRGLAPDLVRLALAQGDRDVAADVAGTVAAGVALAPEVPTVRGVALRCQGMVEADVEPMLEAVAVARETHSWSRTQTPARTRQGYWPTPGRKDEAVVLWPGHWSATKAAAGSIPDQVGQRRRRRPSGGEDTDLALR